MTGTSSKVFDLITGPQMGDWRFAATPVWLWDPAARRPVWANGAALQLWRAGNYAELVRRADPNDQPGLAQLERIGETLAAAQRRVERIRLYVKGQPTNLTCSCAWHETCPEKYLSVTVLDRSAAVAPPPSGDLGSFARDMLAGLGAPAMALAKDGTVLFANSAAGALLSQGAIDQPAANLSGRAELALQADTEGRCRGRIDREGVAISVEAVRIDSPDGGEPFIAVQLLDFMEDADTAVAATGISEGAGAEETVAAGAATVAATSGEGRTARVRQAVFASAGFFSKMMSPEPPAPKNEGPLDPADAEAEDGLASPLAPEAGDEPADIEAEDGLASPLVTEAGDEPLHADVVFTPTQDEPAQASVHAAELVEADSPGGTDVIQQSDNILPFRGPPAFPLSERTELEAHERDAFRALARALGARVEGENRHAAPEPEAAESNEENIVPEEARAEPEPAPTEPDQNETETGRMLLPHAAQLGEFARGDRESAEGASKPRLSAPELESLLAHLPVGLLVYRETAPLYANRTFLDLLGYDSLSELRRVGDVTTLLPQINGGPDISELQVGGSEEERATRLVAHDRAGRAIPVLARLRAVRWDSEAAVLLTVQPAEIASEQAAGAQQPVPQPVGPFTSQELAEIAILSNDGIVVIDEEGRIAALDDRAEILLERSGAEVAGMPFENLFTGDSRSVAADYLDGVRYHGIAGLLGEGRTVRARIDKGGDLPLFLIMGELSQDPARRFCAVLRDLSEWTRSEAELIRARKAAETASAHKSDLLARISHEFRTPLNSVIGFSEVMLEGRFGSIGSDRYRDYVRDIHTSGQHLLGLVNDLLDLSKVEAGKLELNFTRVEINELALQCVRMMVPEANEGRVILRTALAQRLPGVVADHRSLRQILLNLLSNAIKFTLPGGQVALSTSVSEEGEVYIRVRDTGIGMEQEDLALAMKPFHQLSTSSKAGTPGTGLGLPLTKALVELNRAHFRIESRSGEGTLTEVIFPSQRVLAD